MDKKFISHAKRNKEDYRELLCKTDEGIVPYLMAVRGGCLNEVIREVSLRSGNVGPETGSMDVRGNEEVQQLVEKADLHIEICDRVFRESADNMKTAGALCYAQGDFERAKTLTSIALALDPDDANAIY